MTNELKQGFHPNGNIAFEFPMTNELKQGFHPNGNIAYEFPYKHGLRHGILKQWYSDKSLKSNETYTNDKQHGISQRWDQNGQLEYEAYFQDGRLHGIRKIKIWSESSKLHKDYWMHGKPVYAIQYYLSQLFTRR